MSMDGGMKGDIIHRELAELVERDCQLGRTRFRGDLSVMMITHPRTGSEACRRVRDTLVRLTKGRYVTNGGGSGRISSRGGWALSGMCVASRRGGVSLCSRVFSV